MEVRRVLERSKENFEQTMSEGLVAPFCVLCLLSPRCRRDGSKRNLGNGARQVLLEVSQIVALDTC